jgi:hypothetical protein
MELFRTKAYQKNLKCHSIITNYFFRKMHILVWVYFEGMYCGWGCKNLQPLCVKISLLVVLIVFDFTNKPTEVFAVFVKKLSDGRVSYNDTVVC